MELTDKVVIENLCDWPVYFKRINGVGDVKIPARVKNFSTLDVAEVQAQIQSGNNLFIGGNTERPGDHARLYIVNAEQRTALLGGDTPTDDDAVVLTVDTVKELLAVRTKKEFNERLAALVQTDAEKKMIAKVAKEAGGDDVAAWKMEAINQIAGTAVI